MKKIKQILGYLSYSWALAACITCPILFIFLGYISHNAAKLPFMKIHPRYSGGEVAQDYEKDGVRWIIQRPVFDGLIAERPYGFVQVKLLSPQAPSAEQLLDIDMDGNTDLGLQIQDKGAPSLRKVSPNVTGINSWAKSSDGWIIRVGLQNAAKDRFDDQQQ